ncbi:hypothetical protein OG21DRAFT_1487231 [Imleria badia]|nr:hypothetical protein OG21DRAFT_1487231 [Imleria badia]
MPVTLSTPTREAGLITAFLSTSFFLASNSTLPPPPGPPQATVGSSNKTIQLHTIFAIVIGLGGCRHISSHISLSSDKVPYRHLPVGFVVLILAGSFISRLPCFRQPKGVPPTSSRPRPQPLTHINIRRDLHNHNHTRTGSLSRSQPLIQHVEPTIAMMPMFLGRRSRPCDPNTICPPPPYGGPILPPYSEALQHPPQYLHAPPRAVVEV